MAPAHRVAFELTYGVIPVDKPVVMHACDNPPCCNPVHLSAGTHSDNSRDAYLKGRTSGAIGRKREASHRVQ